MKIKTEIREIVSRAQRWRDISWRILFNILARARTERCSTLFLRDKFKPLVSAELEKIGFALAILIWLTNDNATTKRSHTNVFTTKLRREDPVYVSLGNAWKEIRDLSCTRAIWAPRGIYRVKIRAREISFANSPIISHAELYICRVMLLCK